MVEIRNVLCAVDFSDTSRHALEHAAAIAGWYHSKVTALHVMQSLYFASPPVLFADFAMAPSDTDRAQAREWLAEWVSHTPTQGVPIDVQVTDGLPHRRILQYAAGLPADLVVLGTHGRSGVERMLMGSVAEKVLRKAECPVLTVPPKARETTLPYKRLLCPVDFSPSSLLALRFATSLALESDANLMILYVFEWPPDEEWLVEQVDTPDLRSQIEKTTRQRMDRLVSEQVRTWCEPETKLAYGKPYREILDLADRDATDLIVMGVRGRNALDMMLFGSTTNQVVRHATCPVLTLRG